MSATNPLITTEAWQRTPPPADGITTFRLASWAKYFDLLETEVFPASGPKHRYIWRGQRSRSWSLSSSLDRLFDKLNRLNKGPLELERLSAEHLEAFKYAARGRRGPNPAELLENDWWALGQHFGLATPLLDWTRSPFAAAYFAFEELSDIEEFRVVYGLDQDAVQQKNRELSTGPSIELGRTPIVEFIDPMSDENQRLVSQGGLFTRAPIGWSIERWVSERFENSPDPVLLRIEIPSSDRLACLRTLSRMNISHLSLFPDLTGSSRATNLRLELE
ncbi:MAG TPA: FRG domain-containing protein [Candidatus Acidoferrales bacterium]|nr:FRG domain-containing protein [Candidatus Acidoferrales bacterium]